MSRDDEDYLDDPEIIDFNENLDARAAQQMEEEEVPTSPLMFGRTGRGSPEMDLKEPRVLYRDAAKALRREGMDDSHLKDPINLVLNEQQKKEADEKQFDKMLDNMYKQMKNPVKSAVRPSSKKGGTRKRNKRSTRRSRRRSTRRIRKSKRSRRSGSRRK
jgi:hypothetical protein